MQKFKISQKNTKVYECYKLSNSEIKTLVNEIWSARIIADYKVTRSFSSYIAEIKAHKRLYNLNILKSHTCDADLEEPISKLLDFLYKILGI